MSFPSFVSQKTQLNSNVYNFLIKIFNFGQYFTKTRLYEHDHDYGVIVTSYPVGNYCHKPGSNLMFLEFSCKKKVE